VPASPHASTGIMIATLPNARMALTPPAP